MLVLVLALGLYGRDMLGAVALGMCTRNNAAIFAAYFGIINPTLGLFVMIILVVPLAAIVAMVAARLFARQVPTN